MVFCDACLPLARLPFASYDVDTQSSSTVHNFPAHRIFGFWPIQICSCGVNFRPFHGPDVTCVCVCGHTWKHEIMKGDCHGHTLAKGGHRFLLHLSMCVCVASPSNIIPSYIATMERVHNVIITIIRTTIHVRTKTSFIITLKIILMLDAHKTPKSQCHVANDGWSLMANVFLLLRHSRRMRGIFVHLRFHNNGRFGRGRGWSVGGSHISNDPNYNLFMLRSHTQLLYIILLFYMLFPHLCTQIWR